MILYDRLIPATALDGARPDAELLFVGKEGGGPSVPQEETERLMVARAKAGAMVLRLKGGDPFVFGRGGEEALALLAAGIPFEVVPGVTAGVAASAYAGIPVTHRGLASAVALVTGHARRTPTASPARGMGGSIGRPLPPSRERSSSTWGSPPARDRGLADRRGASRLGAGGGRRAGHAAGAAHGRGNPGDDRRCGPPAGVRPPSITVVGQVAALAAELAWLEPGPLAGLTVAVTRARAQSSGLARRLSELGAEVIEAPVIRTSSLPGPPLDPAPYDLVCVTSANGVAPLFERLAAGGRDTRSLAGARVAAIGSGTARALAERGITADVVPERFVAEALLEALEGVPITRALIARARHARDVLPDGLLARGVQVDVLDLYETVAEALAPARSAGGAGADYITFTSSSTVRFFLEAAGGEAGLSAGTRILSIGPVTSAALREHGLEPDLEADPHDIDGLISALLADANARAGLAGTPGTD